MAIEGGSSMQGVSENKWGHGPLARTQPPPTEEEQALEAMMDEIFRSDDEGVAPQSIAEDEDPRPSGLDILGALPDVPPRPTPWGPLAQSYALNDGPPPNRPFLYFKKLREVVVNADANVPHADPIFSEQQLDLWFTEPIFSARDWHPPFLPPVPWLSLMPSETLEAEWKHTVEMCGRVWGETIEPLCNEGPFGYMQATRILNECLVQGNADHVPSMSREALQHIQLEKEFGNLRPEPWRPAVPASPVSDAPTLEMAPLDPQDPEKPEEEPEAAEERSPEFPSESLERPTKVPRRDA